MSCKKITDFMSIVASRPAGQEKVPVREHTFIIASQTKVMDFVSIVAGEIMDFVSIVAGEIMDFMSIVVPRGEK